MDNNQKELDGKNAPNRPYTRGGQRTGAGRKAIGVTRKISLTLPEKYWAEIDRQCERGDYSVSEILRSIVEDYLKEADLV
ncbi:Ribbon-helix-helix protein, copG family [Chlamydia abortus]|uniref:Ribbon-helix-helix domain-containing protein n=1 Tax=Paenibacillus residui TaxID=629724 RepID=A0ABW3DE39_9BACL|nr:MULTISPECIES: ribbon-helix-helix domain-containing protein [Paenibacillaceae]SHE13328.1 Ribbon-helix-helix protein, copG family [Chlamydia abortus]